MIQKLLLQAGTTSHLLDAGDLGRYLAKELDLHRGRIEYEKQIAYIRETYRRPERKERRSGRRGRSSPSPKRSVTNPALAA